LGSGSFVFFGDFEALPTTSEVGFVCPLLTWDESFRQDLALRDEFLFEEPLKKRWVAQLLDTKIKPKINLGMHARAMDPWRDCKRLFEPHFFDRMYDRSLPLNQVEEALMDGKKETIGPVKGNSQEYRVTWGKWTLIAKRVPCTIILRTAFRE
jgi:hypothetical protein